MTREQLDLLLRVLIAGIPIWIVTAFVLALIPYWCSRKCVC